MYIIFHIIINFGLNKDNNVAIEKSLLKKAFKNQLPDEVINRKKSPFPKTYDPKYLSLVEHEIKRIMQNKDDELFKIIDRNYLSQIVSQGGENLKENWFGQLMTYPQTLAYIIQIDYWINIYNIEIEI